jgi:hypothetical protein
MGLGTGAYMQAQILRTAHCLSDEEPRLGQAVERTQKRRHENETLDVGHLDGCMADVVQNQSPGDAIVSVQNSGYRG